MKKSRKFAVGILIGIGLLATGLLFLNNFLERKIKLAIEDNLKSVQAEFKKVDVKLLDRQAEIINPYFQLKGKVLKVDTIRLDDIHIWDYLTDKDLIAGKLKISKPEVKVYSRQKKKDSAARAKNDSGFKNKILLKNVEVTGGQFQVFGKDSAKNKLFTRIRDLRLDDVHIDSSSLKNKVPFDYSVGYLKVDSIFFDLDEQHEIYAENLNFEGEDLQIKNFSIKPKYSRAGHQKTIEVEKDRYDLKIDSIKMSKLSWNVVRDTLEFRNAITGISGVNFDIYRDKTLPDDTTVKPMYSEMIRKMPIRISLDSIRIERANITYSEKIKEDRDPAEVEFANLNASINDLSNIGMNSEEFPRTRINVQTQFMDEAALNVDWSFDVRSLSNRFNISGDMGRLPASEMNRFLKPGMNVEAQGKILSMYFNFSGNGTQASGDMRLEYDDFKVEVLQKDGKKKNTIISALANLIVKNKALNEKANYKEISVKRDKTKSFWNYLWLMIRSGALKAFL